MAEFSGFVLETLRTRLCVHAYVGSRFSYADSWLRACGQTVRFCSRSRAGRSDAANHPESTAHSRSGSVGSAQVPFDKLACPGARLAQRYRLRQSADPREDRPGPETVLRWPPVG